MTEILETEGMGVEEARLMVVKFHVGTTPVVVPAEDVADVSYPREDHVHMADVLGERQAPDGPHRSLRVNKFGGTVWIAVDGPVEMVELTSAQLVPLAVAEPAAPRTPLLGFAHERRGMVALIDLRQVVAAIRARSGVTTDA